MTIVLKGITWNHTRGYLPLVATSQRFMETHPEVELVWEKRSLQEFADFPIQSLIDRYDLLVIDHPWAGYAAGHQAFVPMNEHLPSAFIADQAANSVGLSHVSYNFDGYQVALAIDAATPVSSFRPDLLSRYGMKLPETWEDVVAMAKKGRVAIPAIPIDSLMNWYMLCLALGEEPFAGRENIVNPEVGAVALEHLRELASLCDQEIFSWNPIAVYESMSARDDLAYCPFAYGYSNYARPGYANRLLAFGDLVTFGSSGRLRSTLGGTGIAISKGCKHLESALAYVMYTAGAVTQRTVYAESGGQPGHRSAWLDPALDERCYGYFKATLPALDRAYMRPRYDGYLHFQDHAGDPIRDYMMHGGNTARVLDQLNVLYQESIRAHADHPAGFGSTSSEEGKKK